MKKNEVKLTLNKQTIADLTGAEMGEAKGGDYYTPCWENLWSYYNCDGLWTGNLPTGNRFCPEPTMISDEECAPEDTATC